jgi:hypothetical protein
VEVVVLASIGDFVAFGAPIAEIRTLRPEPDLTALQAAIRDAVVLEEQRDLDADPAFGVEELVTIGWTSISTAKSNPDSGLLTIWHLRDLLARWLATDGGFSTAEVNGEVEAPPVVYTDRLPQQLLQGFESLAVVASESMQHQSLAELYSTFAALFRLLPPVLRRQAADMLERSLSGLGDHILTSDLEAALADLVDALAVDDVQCSRAIKSAREKLSLSVGILNSRATRVTAGG